MHWDDDELFKLLPCPCRESATQTKKISQVWFGPLEKCFGEEDEGGSASCDVVCTPAVTVGLSGDLGKWFRTEDLISKMPPLGRQIH